MPSTAPPTTNEGLYRDLVEDLDAIIWESEPSPQRFTFVSARAEALLGYPLERWMSEPEFGLQLIHPDDRERVLAEYAAALQRGDRHELECRLVTADGRTIWVRNLVVAARDAKGQVIRARGVMTDITQLKRTEDALRAREARNRALIEAVPDLMFLLDRSNVFVECKSNPENELYLPPGQFIGKRLLDVMPPALAPRLAGAADRARGTGETQVVEYELEVGSGARFWEARLVACSEDEVLVLVRDITERTCVQDELRESMTSYRMITDNSIDGIVMLDADGRFVMANPEFCAMLGYTESELLRLNVADITPPEEQDRLAERLRRVEAAGTVEAERTLCRKDGGRITVDLRARWLGGGRILSQARDITERRRVEVALQESEASHRMLMEKATDGISITDGDGNFIMVNPRFCELLGYSREELLTMNTREAVDAADLAHAPLCFESLSKMGSQLTERRLRRKDGGYVHVEISSTVIAGGRFLGISRDVSERRRVDDAMRRTLSLLEATLDSTTDGILVVDINGRIVSYNRRLVEMWRLPLDAMESGDDERAFGVALSQLVDPAGFLAKVSELYAQPEAESFDVLQFKDGRTFERYSRPQRIDGTSVGRVWSFRDVTERLHAEDALRESEEHLRQSQKIEAVGRLAGGVAHDFNNLLTAILGYSQLLRSSLRPEDPRHHSAEEIQRAAERAAGLTRQLLAFSRKQVLEPKVLSLNGVVVDMLEMLRRLIGEHIELVTVLAPDLGQVRADPSQVEQVILNLALNARDAMPEGGRLVIATAELERNEDSPAALEGLGAGRYVTLSVQDSGVGMDEETRQRIFEPFFTTKEVGRGTGLGLATVYGIVKQSGGYIWVESEPGKGARFTISLPRVDAEVPLDPSAPPLGANGKETILLVEDEERVRTLVSAVLARRGYQVIEASHGAQAIDEASRLPGPLHLLIADVVMPGMSGRELAERLATVRPEMRVLYVSGYTDDAIVRHGVGAGAAFLQKPFELDSLVGKVREVLDAGVADTA